MTGWLVGIAVAYVVGSIPFGLLLGLARGTDIREHGSGNIGATNAWRVLGWKLGLTSFVLDVAKGFAPVFIAGAVLGATDPEALTPATVGWWFGVAVAAIVGHMFPAWLRFKGGKGVATGLGVMLGIWPLGTVAGASALGVWVVVLLASRYVSLASCLAASALPIATVATLAFGVGPGETFAHRAGAVWPALLVNTLLGAMVIARHRANLRRLLRGQEHRVGRKRN